MFSNKWSEVLGTQLNFNFGICVLVQQHFLLHTRAAFGNFMEILERTGISQALGTLKCCCPSSCLSPESLRALCHLSFSQSLGRADRPLVQLGKCKVQVLFQHLIWRPSASQASRVLCACHWERGFGVMLWYTGSADVCVGTTARPQVCPQSPGAIFKKFLAVFLVRSRIWFSLDDSHTSFSFALETDSNYPT